MVSYFSSQLGHLFKSIPFAATNYSQNFISLIIYKISAVNEHVAPSGAELPEPVMKVKELKPSKGQEGKKRIRVCFITCIPKVQFFVIVSILALLFCFNTWGNLH